MGYGGRAHGFHGHHGVRHHHHHRYRRGRPMMYLRFGGPRRRYHHYGVHHVYHTRAYYVGAENATQPPPPPPYNVIYETQSQFQKIKIVEFTNQPVTVTAQPIQQQQQQLVTSTNNNNNNNNNITEELPSYNPESEGPDAIQAYNSQPATNTLQNQSVPFSTNDGFNNEMKVNTNNINNNNNNVNMNTNNPVVFNANGQQMQGFNVVIVGQQGQKQRGLVLEDEIQFSTLDEADYHNALVHSGMDQLLSLGMNNLLRVLIIGGGDCLCIRELVKYDRSIVTEITMIEIDQMVVDTCKQYFPSFCEGLKDSRVNVIYNDANLYVKQQIQNRLINNYDLIICDLTEDGTISLPLINTEFWNNLSQMLKCDVNGVPTGLIVRNGYHKPIIHRNGNENDIILSNSYYISTYLPTFGGNYVFSILSHNPIYGNITDFANVDKVIKDKNNGNNIQTKCHISNENELMYSYNWYFYNPEPEEPWYQRYSGWIVLILIVIIVVVIIVVSDDDSSSSSNSSSSSGSSGGGGGFGGRRMLLDMLGFD